MVHARVQIDDATYDEIHERAIDAGRPTDLMVAQLLVAAVKQTRGLPTGARTLLLGPTELEALETRLGGGSVLNGQDLVRKVERLASISYGHISLPFTPGMLEEVVRRAERLSLTPEQLIERTALKIYELFFTHLGAGSQG